MTGFTVGRRLTKEIASGGGRKEVGGVEVRFTKENVSLVEAPRMEKGRWLVCGNEPGRLESAAPRIDIPRLVPCRFSYNNISTVFYVHPLPTYIWLSFESSSSGGRMRCFP